MTKILSLLALAALASQPAWAESSASSAVSDSASSATSSASNSIEGSSNSSSGNKKVAAGEYRVIEMAAATDKPQQPGLQRVLLRKDSDGSEVRLLLPLAAAERGQLAAGRKVLVNERPYGYEFAAADTRQAFFLVLEDAWQRELQARPVVL
jgi:hypothetical protein